MGSQAETVTLVPSVTETRVEFTPAARHERVARWTKRIVCVRERGFALAAASPLREKTICVGRSRVPSS